MRRFICHALALLPFMVNVPDRVSAAVSPTAAKSAATAPSGLARAANVRFHYADPAAAARFYREQLGLVPVAEREDEIVLEVADGAFLTLAALESGGFDPATPRTAAVALVTDQLDEWWEALKDRDLNIRSKGYDPVPGRAHHGFVIVDPGGWYLEFERFNPHPENVALLPRLEERPTRLVDAEGAGLPSGLGFKATILWQYYDDLAEAEQFVVDVLGRPLVVDQGWAKVHQIAPGAWLGLVDGARGMHAFTPDKAVALEFLDDRHDGWRSWLRHRDVEPVSIGDGGIEVRDPGNYLLRWRRPLIDQRNSRPISFDR